MDSKDASAFKKKYQVFGVQGTSEHSREALKKIYWELFWDSLYVGASLTPTHSGLGENLIIEGPL